MTMPAAKASHPRAPQSQHPLLYQRATRTGGRARRSKFCWFLIKWKVKSHRSLLQGAAAVCMAEELHPVINFMEQGL